MRHDGRARHPGPPRPPRQAQNSGLSAGAAAQRMRHLAQAVPPSPGSSATPRHATRGGPIVASIGRMRRLRAGSDMRPSRRERPAGWADRSRRGAGRRRRTEWAPPAPGPTPDRCPGRGGSAPAPPGRPCRGRTRPHPTRVGRRTRAGRRLRAPFAGTAARAIPEPALPGGGFGRGRRGERVRVNTGQREMPEREPHVPAEQLAGQLDRVERLPRVRVLVVAVLEDHTADRRAPDVIQRSRPAGPRPAGRPASHSGSSPLGAACGSGLPGGGQAEATGGRPRRIAVRHSSSSAG
jgi:hypothetical protein